MMTLKDLHPLVSTSMSKHIFFHLLPHPIPPELCRTTAQFRQNFLNCLQQRSPPCIVHPAPSPLTPSSDLSLKTQLRCPVPAVLSPLPPVVGHPGILSHPCPKTAACTAMMCSDAISLETVLQVLESKDHILFSKPGLHRIHSR